MMGGKKVNKMAASSPMVYTLTPEITFTPSTTRAQRIYKIGSKLPNTETRHVEYKIGSYAISNLEQHIRKYGSAFLNSGGGTLTLGIADDGTVVGIDAIQYSRERMKRKISEEFKSFYPSVDSSYYEIDFVATDDKEKFVMEVHVRAGDDDEIYVDRENKMFIRRDGSVQGPLWPRAIKDIVIEKFTKVLDECSDDDVKRKPMIELSNATPVIEHHKKKKVH